MLMAMTGKTFHWLRRFGGALPDNRGGMAVMAAVMAIPLAICAFAAAEYSRVTTLHSRLQNALDAAALAVAVSDETDPAKVQAMATTILRGELPTISDSGDVRLTSLTVTDSDGDVKVTAILTVKPLVSHLLMAGDLTVSTSALVGRLNKKFEIALVLDNTYSMLTNNRIGTLKTAATNFVDKLHTSAARTRVADALKISVVPFATTVNVGTTTTSGTARDAANSPWLDWTAASPYHRDMFIAPVNPALPAANRMQLFTKLGVPWGGCVETRPAPYDVQDTPAAVATPATLFVPYFAPDEPDGAAYHDYGPDYYVNNYMNDGSSGNYWARQKNVDKYHATSPTVKTSQFVLTTGASGANYHYGPNFGCAMLKPVVPLTTDTGAGGKVRLALQNLTVIGDTNIPIGMAWGWHALSPNSPFAEKGAAYTDTGVRKIVVLMTDGDNQNIDNLSDPTYDTNHSLYSSLGYMWQNRLGITATKPYGTMAERKAKMDDRFALLCQNMKAAGVVIYTIRVEQTGDGSLMRNCASEPGYYHDVQPGQLATLDAAFKHIAESIINMRVKT